MEINFIEHPLENIYIYRKRSCRNCDKFPDDCIVFQRRTSKAPTCDRAKCGCENYAGAYNNEKPMSSDKKKRKGK